MYIYNIYYIIISSRSKFHLRKNTHKMTCPKNGVVFGLFDPRSFAKPNIFAKDTQQGLAVGSENGHLFISGVGCRDGG